MAFRLRARHYNSWTGIQSNWWFNGNPELPPDPNQYAHQNNFLASGDLTVSGPGAWQHQFSGFEYHHVVLNVNPVDDLDRPFDSAFNSLTKYNVAGFAYQGIYSPRSWAQTTLGYNFQDENGYINNNSDAGITPTHGLRFNNYLFAQQTIVWRRLSVLAGVGYVNNSDFGGKVSPRASLTFLAAARKHYLQRHTPALWLRGGNQGAQLRADVWYHGDFPHAAESQPPTRTEPRYRGRCVAVAVQQSLVT